MCRHYRNGEGSWDHRADIWSLGLVVHAVLTLTPWDAKVMWAGMTIDDQHRVSYCYFLAVRRRHLGCDYVCHKCMSVSSLCASSLQAMQKHTTQQSIECLASTETHAAYAAVSTALLTLYQLGCTSLLDCSSRNSCWPKRSVHSLTPICLTASR